MKITLRAQEAGMTRSRYHLIKTLTVQLNPGKLSDHLFSSKKYLVLDSLLIFNYQ
jgi:hypothetical protein